MTFKAYIDGVPKYGDDIPESDEAKEVVITSRYNTYTLYTDGSYLIIQCDGDFKTIHLDKPRQIRLEAL